jgi:hypothetical protein
MYEKILAGHSDALAQGAETQGGPGETNKQREAPAEGLGTYSDLFPFPEGGSPNGMVLDGEVPAGAEELFPGEAASLAGAKATEVGPEIEAGKYEHPGRGEGVPEPDYFEQGKASPYLSSTIRKTIRSVLGETLPTAAHEETPEYVLQEYWEKHPAITEKQMTSFIDEMGQIDKDTMGPLFGEEGDSQKNRFTLMASLLGDERLRLEKMDIKTIDGLEDLIEDNGRFHTLLKDKRLAEKNIAEKLAALNEYLFGEKAVKVTDKNKDELVTRILRVVAGRELRMN